VQHVLDDGTREEKKRLAAQDSQKKMMAVAWRRQIRPRNLALLPCEE
jgi:hypothetical protein